MGFKLVCLHSGDPKLRYRLLLSISRAITDAVSNMRCELGIEEDVLASDWQKVDELLTSAWLLGNVMM